MAYTIEEARKIYAMGMVPARNAGFDPWAALEVIQAANVADADAKAEARLGSIHVGQIVNDGKLGKVVEVDGYRVKLAGYFGERWSHIGRLHDWSYTPTA